MKRPKACRLCPFDDGGKRDEFCGFTGPPDADLLAVAEAPAVVECANEEPLTGPSGYRFNTALRHAGIDRSDVRLGNTILCRAPHEYDASDGRWAGAIAHCARAHTEALLDQIRPKVVVTMGAPALMRHTGFAPFHKKRIGHESVLMNGIDKVRGSVYRASELLAMPVKLAHGHEVTLPKWGGGDPWIIPTIHPASLLPGRGGTHLKPVLAHDLERAMRYVMGIQDVNDEPLMEYFDLNPKDDPITPLDTMVVFDIETGEHDEITMIGVGSQETRRVAVMPDGLPVRSLLADAQLTKSGHNLAFDIKGVGLNPDGGPWWDTIMAAALVNPTLPRSLSDVTSLYGGDAYFYWKDMVDNPRTRHVVMKRLGLLHTFVQFDRLYNAYDVWWTMVDQRTLAKELRHAKLIELMVGMHMPLVKELLGIERRGMLVDPVRLKKRRAEVGGEIDSLKEEVTGGVRKRADTRVKGYEGALDVVERGISREIREHGVPCVEHPGFDGLQRKTKCPGCAALYEIARGIREPYTKGRALLRGRIKKLAEVAFDPAPGSGDWGWLIYGKAEDGGLGLKPPLRTKKGKGSLGKDALRALLARAGTSEEAHGYLMAKFKLGKLASRLAKYLNPQLEADGRIHPAYAQHKAVNFRFSSGTDETDVDKPNSRYPINAQNYPEDCRSIIIAPTDWWFVELDYSSIEDWTTAFDVWKVTGRREYFDFLSTPGMDVHQVTADMIHREGGMPVTRKQGKTGRHGWKYGMRAKKLALTRAGEGITFKMAKAIIGSLDGLHPDIVQWWHATWSRLERYPLLVNAFGHHCPFTLTRAKGRDGVALDEPNLALAWGPSSTASDISKRAWLAMGADRLTEGPDSRLVNHSHDSFAFELRGASIEDVAPMAQRIAGIMARPVDALITPEREAFVPGVGIKVGRNWGPHHMHGEDCEDSEKCEESENREGLKEVKWTTVLTP